MKAADLNVVNDVVALDPPTCCITTVCFPYSNPVSEKLPLRQLSPLDLKWPVDHFPSSTLYLQLPEALVEEMENPVPERVRTVTQGQQKASCTCNVSLTSEAI